MKPGPSELPPMSLIAVNARTSGLLPAHLAEGLVNAASTSPGLPPGASERRTKEINAATKRARAACPHLFQGAVK